ncbi:phosphatase PAP2 family protein [Burkholderia stagnalis]
MTNRVRKVLTGTALLTVAVALADIFGARSAGIALTLGHAAYFAGFAGCGVVAAAMWFASTHGRRHRAPAWARGLREPALAVVCVVLLAALGEAVVVFDYLCVARAPPSIETDLVRLDAMFGFHWPDLYRWVRAHPDLQRLLEFAYRSSIAQLIAVPFVLAMTRRHDDLAEFVTLFALALFIVVLVSAPLPAESAFVHFGITDPGTASTVSHYDLLRRGQFHQMNLSEPQGLVSLPSFHVMLALLLAYAVRHVRYVFPAAVALNLAMIASTPTQGGHYLADVLGGIVCGVLSIVVARRWAAARRMGAPAGPRAARPT